MDRRHISCSVEGCGGNAHRYGGGKCGYCSKHYRRWKKHGNPMHTYEPARPAQEWLLSHRAYAGDDCLRWPFHIGADGYGRAHDVRRGCLTTAARLMCELVHGVAPSSDHEAAHKCGRGSEGCVNPRHLRWATPAENHADKIAHGTTNRGERQGQSRLTAGDVLQIRRMQHTMPAKAIAVMFGVTPGHVSRILSRKVWGWLGS